MEPNDDIVAVPASSNPNNMPATDPALIAILSAIQQTMAENKNLILELKSSSHHAPVASKKHNVPLQKKQNHQPQRRHNT